MNQLASIAIATMVLGAGPGPDDGPGQAASDEMRRLEGTWQLLYAETDGKQAPTEGIGRVRVKIEEGSHSVFFGDEEVAHQVSFRVDPTTNPKSSVDTLNDPDNLGKQIKGIYRLDEGDTLVSCVGAVGADAPGGFTTSPGSGHSLRVFQRVKEGEGAEAAAVRDELICFGGTWTYESMELEGQQLPAQGLAGAKLMVKGPLFELIDPTATYRGSFKVDPKASPKTIDVTFTEGPEAGKTSRGIYELEGDTYRVCIALTEGERPTEFAAKAGSGQALQVMKRKPR